MTDKFYDVPTKIDELNLSLRGWTADNVRARLIVPDHSPNSGEFAKLTVSYRARFNSQDWTDRFRELEHDSYTPPIVIVVSEPALTPVATVVEQFERVRKAERGITETIPPDWLGAPKRWRPTGELSVTLTAYDSAHLSMSDFDLYRAVMCPIEIVDETNPYRPYRLTDISAQLLRRLDRDSDHTCLRLEGVATVDQRAAREPRSKYDYGELYPPELKVEVLDETGFPMATVTADSMSYSVRTDQIPARAARWISDTGLNVHAKPSRIIVRIVDNDRDDDPDNDDDEVRDDDW